ncbi:NAD(P)H-dependent flavin oxidoreductase [Pararhodobacter marinus]|uniref:Nitronate monooxygenase n=1 Tax=Pararhodobacter marinus TaxID=2184063 RepID=A0A2U2C5R8_9RHOB|nr:nitronate monooxygenase [Pararhodobacter marinus]PWE27181.1 nitronate monooxygenase [Pararhodobacter marinus]
MTLKDRLACLRLPAFAAPMFLVSGPDLVVACSKAGIIGSFPAPNLRTSEELGGWLSDIRSRLTEDDAPWALNLVTHSTSPRLPGDLEQVAEYQPPVVITALGSPKPVIPTVHAYGGLVFADVISVELAKKAADAGVDGLVLVCSGAGGHTGELSPLVFVERVRRFFDGYIALGGAINTGEAILAAQVLGADFGYIGTAFLAAEENIAQPEYREMCIQCDASDLMVTRAFTGARASMMKPSMINKGLDPAELEFKVAKMNFTGRQNEAVKPWSGIWAAGQGVGKIEAVEPTAVIVDRLAREYDAAKARTRSLCA